MKTQLDKNEEIVLVIKKHWFVLLSHIIWTFTLLITIIVVAELNAEYRKVFLAVGLLIILRFIYKIIDRNNNLWVVTNLRVIDEYGVFSSNSKETPLDKINNISCRQPFLGRIFNYGDIQIQSAAENGKVFQRMIERPELLKDTIIQCQERYKDEQLREQAQSLANVSNNHNQPESNTIDVAEELTKLHKLEEEGIITAEDFEKRKYRILNS